ncbi:MAG: hemolysin III family protein [Clostridia bacterium]|nr:hemolysin III family protein [Clostridia bacterium]
MKRTKLADRMLPIYTKGEEIFNMTTHIVGGGLGIVALVLCVVFAAIGGNVYGVVSGAIYGATMIILYAMSSIYHGLKPEMLAKKVFQVIDHCSIFLLIAGTYTPIALCSLREYSPWLGWTIFGVVWGMAALGIALNSIDLKKYSIFSMICYLVMGWCIIVAAKPAWAAVGADGMNMILAGGILYTLGAIFYGIGVKKKYIHSVFHIFVVLGSVVHFLAILIYVM